MTSPTPPSAPTSASASTSPLMDLLADGFQLSTPNRIPKAYMGPVVTVRRSGDIRLNRPVLEAFGPMSRIFLLVDPDRHRLAIVAGRPEDATVMNAVPRLVGATKDEALFQAQSEVTVSGLLGESSRRFRPGRLERGVLVIEAARDEIPTPVRAPRSPKAAAAGDRAAAPGKVSTTAP